LIFVDTSFWLAFHLPRDTNDDEALSLMRQVSAELLVTSNHVRGETWTFLRRRPGTAQP
jgi:predicted nucleic acid-binding protein